MTSEITNEWLESLTFFHPSHLPDGVLELRTCGHELRTWNGIAGQCWILDGLAVHPRPERKADVKALIRRLRRDGR